MLVCTLYTVEDSKSSKNTKTNTILRQWSDFIEPFDSSFGGYKNGTQIKVETVDCSVFPSSVRASSTFPRWSFVLNNEFVHVNELTPSTISGILGDNMHSSPTESSPNNTTMNETFLNETYPTKHNKGLYVKFKDAYIKVGGELWSYFYDEYDLEKLSQHRIESYCKTYNSETESVSHNDLSDNENRSDNENPNDNDNSNENENPSENSNDNEDSMENPNRQGFFTWLSFW